MPSFYEIAARRDEERWNRSDPRRITCEMAICTKPASRVARTARCYDLAGVRDATTRLRHTKLMRCSGVNPLQKLFPVSRQQLV